mmetsp:Transcript_59250/g.158570  ORF Transcript_59250/g.158570 Transcript_59250/m.158570 type:complete len:227 (+) Transcript_59250:1654-2334(+)
MHGTRVKIDIQRHPRRRQDQPHRIPAQHTEEHEIQRDLRPEVGVDAVDGLVELVEPLHARPVFPEPKQGVITVDGVEILHQQPPPHGVTINDIRDPVIQQSDSVHFPQVVRLLLFLAIHTAFGGVKTEQLAPAEEGDEREEGGVAGAGAQLDAQLIQGAGVDLHEVLGLLRVLQCGGLGEAYAEEQLILILGLKHERLIPLLRSAEKIQQDVNHECLDILQIRHSV